MPRTNYMGFEILPNRSLGKHDLSLTEIEAAVVDYIGTWCQRSGEEAIPAQLLADYVGISKRKARTVITHLVDRRYHHQPIYSQPGDAGGYFLGQGGNIPQARKAAAGHRKRAVTGLRKARDLGAQAEELAQDVVQLTLGLDVGAAQEMGEGVITKLAAAGVAVGHDAITSTLARYAGDPARYAREIEDIASQFSGVFVRRSDLEKLLKEKTAQAVRAVMAELAGGEVA